MKTQIIFYGRIVLAWAATFLITMMFVSAIGLDRIQDLVALLMWIALILLMIAATSHLQRVERLVGTVDADKLRNRHTRHIEIPFEAAIALPMFEQSLKVLPLRENVKTSNSGLRFRARVRPMDLENDPASMWKRMMTAIGIERSNHFIADAEPGESAVSVKLVCEPEGIAILDYLFPDEGTNLQNIEAITRDISQRIAAYRRGEQAFTTETVAEKELAVAKLSLLHSQVEPHFLYNTLGSAKYLIAGEPAKAEAMIDNLILYLRHSLPRDADAPSTLGDEMARTRAYLDILKIRMDERLQVHIDLPDDLAGIAFPSMMLQTLAENAINHGLEPKTGGGRIWITARRDLDGESVSVTVADDGIGFGGDTSGTGIGLKNVRERLKLAYGSEASFAIVANFPEGVAASIRVPSSGPIVRS